MKVTNFQLGAVQEDAPGIIEAHERLASRPKNAGLATKARRSRREVLQAIQDREAIRREYLEEFAEKDEAGQPVTYRLPGEDIDRVRLADESGFNARYLELLMTEVELTVIFGPEDFENQPAGFYLENELELLGPIYLDPEERPRGEAPRPRSKRRRRASGRR